MIDTVQIFHPHSIDKRSIPAGLKCTNSITPVIADETTNAKRCNHTFSCDNQTNGYHAFGTPHCATYHRASLPRLLHGTNGKLILNQAEVNAAMDLLHEQASTLGRPEFEHFHFTRVDLVYQFRGDPAKFVLAHRHARHPRIRGKVHNYSDRSLVFKGSEMRITIYDKLREITGKNGDVTRVEIRLGGRRLKEELGAGELVTSLNFNTCYQAYRRILMGFQPVSIPEASGIAQLLAVSERERWTSNGVSAFDIYASGLCERQIRRLRSAMANLRPEVHSFDWSTLLPAEGPPPPVDIVTEVSPG